MNIAPFPRIGSIRTLTLLLPGFTDLISSNVFVLGDGPLTLIDTGPKFPGSFAALEQQLHALGFSWHDVEHILITHGHIDHFGLVGMIRQAAGRAIPCYIHVNDQWRLSRTNFESGMWGEETDRFCVYAGIPEHTVEQMKRRSLFFKELGDPVDDVLAMYDGDIFYGPGFELTLIHTPGHSPGSSCLYERQSQVLFSGDHLLKHITPNPFHELNRSHLSDPDYKSLRAYMQSLLKLEPLTVCAIFPAHGEYIPDLITLIEGYRVHHEQRSAAIRHILEADKYSLYGLMRTVFPAIKESEVFLGVSEVFVHLEMLIEAGQAALVEQGPPACFHAS